MKNLMKGGIIAFAFGLIFISVDTANAQYRGNRNREARREYREDVRDARQDYRRRVNQGNYRKARREYREDIRDARQDYRRDTRNYYGNRRYYRNNRYYNNNRRYYRSNRYYNRYGSGSLYDTRRTRVYYRNGRRYIVRY